VFSNRFLGPDPYSGYGPDVTSVRVECRSFCRHGSPWNTCVCARTIRASLLEKVGHRASLIGNSGG
jgi:hypothetical protein